MNPNELIEAAFNDPSDVPDVTWIGPNPIGTGLCLGFDDGTVIISDDETGSGREFPPTTHGGEAINGVAGVGSSSLAYSNRSEVSFIQLKAGNESTRAVFPGGAHGVVATKSGFFVAPLGPAGLLIARPTDGFEQEMFITRGTEEKLYFYHMAALHDSLGMETLIFANRKNGVGLTVFEGTKGCREIRVMGFEGIDVVDVCRVSPGSLSAIAITSAADLLWLEDTSKTNNPRRIKLSHVEGTVYKVLATARHLFVLTSKALYAWINLVERIRFGQPIHQDVTMFVSPADAVDMSLIEDQILHLVMGVNKVESVSIAEIEKRVEDHVARPKANLTFERLEKPCFDDIAAQWHTQEPEYTTVHGQSLIGYPTSQGMFLHGNFPLRAG